MLSLLKGDKKVVIIGAGLILLLLAGGAVYTLTKPVTAGGGQSLFTVQRGTVEAMVSTSGVVEATNQVSLSFPAGGTLSFLGVKSGDQVSQGQTLAQEDQVPLQEAANVAQATLSLAQAKLAQLANPTPQGLSAYQTALGNAKTAYADAQQGYQAGLTVDQAAYVQAQAALTNDQTALTQAENLYGWSGPGQPIMTPQVVAALNLVEADKSKVVAAATALQNPAALQIPLDQAQAALQSAQNSYNLATNPDPNTIAAAQAAVTQAQATADAAQYNLGKAQITAPFAGTVASTGFNQGDSVSPNVPVVTLVGSGPGSLEVVVQVSQDQIGQVAPGQAVVITTADFPGRDLSGTVLRTDPSATVTGGQATYGVTILLQGGDLRPGMDVNAAIQTGSVKDALYIPVAALQQVGAAWGVYVEGGGQYQFKSVATGLSGGKYIQVTKGLVTGEKILSGAAGN